MSKAGKLTVGNLCGKRPAVAPSSASWWRKSAAPVPKGTAAAQPRGYCCGSGCPGCPYMVGSTG